MNHQRATSPTKTHPFGVTKARSCCAHFGLANGNTGKQTAVVFLNYTVHGEAFLRQFEKTKTSTPNCTCLLPPGVHTQNRVAHCHPEQLARAGQPEGHILAARGGTTPSQVKRGAHMRNLDEDQMVIFLMFGTISWPHRSLVSSGTRPPKENTHTPPPPPPLTPKQSRGILNGQNWTFLHTQCRPHQFRRQISTSARPQ